MAGNDRPAPTTTIVAIDNYPRSRALIQSILERRFGADYRIVVEETAAAGLDALGDLRDEGADVALVIAGSWLLDTNGIDLLAQVPSIHRDAQRALIVAWGDQTFNTLVKAFALGQIDAFVQRPWHDPDEQFCHAVSELLDEWDRSHRPQFEAVLIVADRWDPDSHALQDALQRSNVPYGFHDAASAEGQELLALAGVTGSPLPVAVLFDGQVLVRPTPGQIADALGVNTDPGTETFDLTIVGSGPAGLAAAVYGASEGLAVLVLENEALGGQAGTSSLIRNYLGFPRGLSGSDLTNRAYLQAWILGARFLIGQAVVTFRSEPDAHVLVLADGAEIRSRAVMLASGVSYRRIGIETLDALVGRGVFYGAGVTEAPGMADEEVFVVGGANSAGQAAIYLSRFAAHVTLLVRGPSLSEMSEYLIRDLHARDNIAIRLGTVVVDGHGKHRLERVMIRDTAADTTEEVRATALFIMIGASPKTGWLPPEVERDERGYVLTGEDLSAEATNAGPPAFQTSVPGVFAVGDVRAGSMKRVAAAVGEGSSAIRFVHEYLGTAQPTPAQPAPAPK
jgi:thioredoxin reductase (NADPH)